MVQIYNTPYKFRDDKKWKDIWSCGRNKKQTSTIWHCREN